MAEEDVVTIDDHTKLDEEDASETELPGGSLLLSHPDESSVARQMSVVESLIVKQIKEVRRLYETLGKQLLRTNPNASGSIQFRRYGLTAGQTAIMIVKEKMFRGDTVITNYTDGATVYIGLDSGIGVAGLNTVAIVGGVSGAARTVRCRNALWAICDVTCVIDVQEEFD